MGIHWPSSPATPYVSTSIHWLYPAFEHLSKQAPPPYAVLQPGDQGQWCTATPLPAMSSYIGRWPWSAPQRLQAASGGVRSPHGEEVPLQWVREVQEYGAAPWLYLCAGAASGSSALPAYRTAACSELNKWLLEARMPSAVSDNEYKQGQKMPAHTPVSQQHTAPPPGPAHYSRQPVPGTHSHTAKHTRQSTLPVCSRVS